MAPDVERAWRYVGRFMWSYAMIEIALDDIITKLFQLGITSGILFTRRLGFREKIIVARACLDIQGIDLKATLKEAEELMAVRNMIAHNAFGPETLPSGSGIHFEYTSKDPKALINHDNEYGPTEGRRTWEWNITYEKFDEYHSMMERIEEILSSVAAQCKPIEQGDEMDEELTDSIQRELSTHNNIVQFPSGRDIGQGDE